MKRKVYLIPKDDLVYYPPTLSLINVLLDNDFEVVCIGRYTDLQQKRNLEERGVVFVPIYRQIKDVSRFRYVNWLVMLFRLWTFKRKMEIFFSKEAIEKNDLIWLIYTGDISCYYYCLRNYNYVIQFYEFEDFALGGKQKILHPHYNATKFFSQAKALIHCEYNRAMITNALYGLKTPPVILPNKPYEITNPSTYIPEAVHSLMEDIKTKVHGKRVILYQGMFDPHERRLEEFCEAMNYLPDNFIFIAMGGQGGYFDEIKQKYSTDNILFIPFVKPPYHLQITALAHYGILTYFPAGLNYVDVLNPLYCAPNKIFEYGKFGIPMIANDVPGLKQIFEKYECGHIITNPITPRKIADTVIRMEQEYDKLSKNSLLYYNSVDVEEIVMDVINSL